MARPRKLGELPAELLVGAAASPSHPSPSPSMSPTPSCPALSSRWQASISNVFRLRKTSFCRSRLTSTCSADAVGGCRRTRSGGPSHSTLDPRHAQRVTPTSHIMGALMPRRGWADGWHSSTRLRWCRSCKAQRGVLAASGRIQVHFTNTNRMLDVKPSRESNHVRTPLQIEALT